MPLLNRTFASFGTAISASGAAALLLFFTVGCQGGGSGSTASGTTTAGAGGAIAGGTTGGGGGGGGGGNGAPGTPVAGGGDLPTGTTPAGTGAGGAANSGTVGGGDGTSPGISLDPGPSGGTTTRVRGTFTGNALSDGLSTVPITVQNTDAMQIVLVSPGVNINAALQDPLGRLVVAFQQGLGSRQQTYAVFQSPSVNAMPYPTSGLDAAMVAGTYLEGANFSVPSVGFSGTVIVKNDPDFGTGTLRVNAFLVTAASQTPNTVTAVNDAIDQWKTIYAQAGINLDVQVIDIDGPATLPNPTTGAQFYLTQSSSVRTDALNVFLGQSIADTDNTNGQVIGVAAAIPGPDAPTTRTAVVVSLLNHTNSGGMIDTSLLAETMAHEGGHYLGLFHPVEIDSGNNEATYQFSEGDLLPDTPVCLDVPACKGDGLAQNLMFPTALSGVSQRSLSAAQVRVLNLQVMVD